MPPAPASLVAHGHNSATKPERSRWKKCPKSRWVRGGCDHNTVRWVAVRCKRRDCEVCGPLGRYAIAQRIAWGIRQIEERGGRCAWLVLTFPQDVTKKEAVRRLNAFIRWLRKPEKPPEGVERGGRRGRRWVPGGGMGDLEYAATYEVTKRGRLHINVIAGPWRYTPQEVLQERWGGIVWVALVKDEAAMGKEAAKAYSPESLGSYLSKLEQAVPEDRRVSFSRGWPKMPEGGMPRRGHIRWELPSSLECQIFAGQLEAGKWVEVAPGEYAWAAGEACACFEPDWLYALVLDWGGGGDQSLGVRGPPVQQPVQGAVQEPVQGGGA